MIYTFKIDLYDLYLIALPSTQKELQVMNNE